MAGAAQRKDGADEAFEALLAAQWREAPPAGRGGARPPVNDEQFEALLGTFRGLGSPGEAAPASGPVAPGASPVRLEAEAQAARLVRAGARLVEQPGDGQRAREVLCLAINLQIELARGQSGRVLVLEERGQTFALALEEVIEVLGGANDREQTGRVSYGGEWLALRGTHGWWSAAPADPRSGNWIVVLRSGGRRVALAAEHVRRVESVTLAAAGALWAGARGVRAAARLAGGQVVPVVEPALLWSASERE